MSSVPRTDVLIVTPSVDEAAGGAAVYTRLLVDGLADAGLRVAVAGDRAPARLRAELISLFPRRCGRQRARLRDMLAYAGQNVAYTALPGLVERLRPRAVLIHTGFLNFPGIFPQVLARVAERARRQGTRLVADARDAMLPPGAARHLERFDAVLACSESVERHLVSLGVAAERVTRVPVLQEPLAVEPAVADRLLADLGLEAGRYLLYAGLVKEAKGVDLLLEAFLEHVRPQRPDLELVVCGQLKSGDPLLRARLRAAGVRWLGPRLRHEVLLLAARAGINVHVSPCEGLPRASLEALALGRPVLLPAGVPEFEQHCPRFVSLGRDPARLGGQLLSLLGEGRAPTYPCADHEPKRVIPTYRRALGLAPAEALAP